MKLQALSVDRSGESRVVANFTLELTIIAIEWAMGAWIISGFARIWARRCSVLLLIVFIMIAGARWLKGDADCGCFGRVRVNPGVTLLLDLGALVGFSALTKRIHLAADLKTRCANSSPASRLGTWIRCICASCIALGVTITTMFLARPATAAAPVVLLQPEQWVGKQCPMLRYLTGDLKSLMWGHVTIALVDRHCHRCKDYLSTMRASIHTGPMYIVDIAPADDSPGLLALDWPLVAVPLRSDNAFISDVPYELSLVDGIVIRVSRPTPT